MNPKAISIPLCVLVGGAIGYVVVRPDPDPDAPETEYRTLSVSDGVLSAAGGSGGSTVDMAATMTGHSAVGMSMTVTPSRERPI